ncbi:RNA binding protein HABP4/SERBP1-like protein [Abortiporus biennis]
MSVASKNPFALLEEDSSRPSSPAPAAKQAAAAAAPTNPARTQRGRGGPASRGGRYYSRGGKSGAPREENGDAADESGEPKRRFDGEGRGRGRGRGRGDRGRGRGGHGRVFDKHSATGKTDSEKKIHQGWGGDEGVSELKAEVSAVTDAAADATEGGWGEQTTESWGAAIADAPAEGASPAAEGEKGEGRRGRERVEEEEDNTLTLDQYLQQQKEKELALVPKLETRKANEGDDSIWKDAVVVNKKDEEETAYFVGKTKASAPKTKVEKKEKVFLEIDARFERPSRGGRGRGDRGGERGERRGGRGRGGRGRANGTNAPSLDVDDQTAFPSLS